MDDIENRHVLLVKQNNSVPYDAHVWHEINIIRKICNNTTMFKIEDYKTIKRWKELPIPNNDLIENAGLLLRK